MLRAGWDTPFLLDLLAGPWNDPDLAIPWPEPAPLLSDKDRGWLPLDPGRRDLPRL